MEIGPRFKKKKICAPVAQSSHVRKGIRTKQFSVQIGFVCFRIRPTAGSCEYINGNCVPIKEEKYLE
jgi:hypothetical protein